MGDDSVEGYVPFAKKAYEKLGHTCKEYIPCDTGPNHELRSVNFCSHKITQHKHWLTSWSKTLFRFLHREPDMGYEDMEMELAQSPEWGRIKSYVLRGNPQDKDNGEEQAQESSQDWRNPGWLETCGELTFSGWSNSYR